VLSAERFAFYCIRTNWDENALYENKLGELMHNEKQALAAQEEEKKLESERLQHKVRVRGGGGSRCV